MWAMAGTEEGDLGLNVGQLIVCFFQVDLDMSGFWGGCGVGATDLLDCDQVTGRPVDGLVHLTKAPACRCQYREKKKKRRGN